MSDPAESNIVPLHSNDFKKPRRQKSASVDLSKLDRLPPHSIEAEQGVLGCVLLSPTESLGICLEKLKAGGEVFYDLRHQTLFTAFVTMLGTRMPIDLITVQQRLKDLNQLEDVGGLAYLSGLMDAVPSAANLAYYLDIVREKHVLRKILQTCTAVLGRVHEHEGEVDQLLDEVEREILKISQDREHTPKAGLSCRTPDEILAMPDDPQDSILGDRLLTRGGQLVIAGAGGTGKSRLVMQMAASVVTGRDFLTFRTNGSNLKWLILQAENDNARLKVDNAGLQRWLGDSWAAFAARVKFHTLETEMDSWLSVGDAEAAIKIRELLAEEKPDVVVIDSLYNFGVGDLNKDVDMKSTLSQLRRLIHHGNPKRAMVVIHHALTGKPGLAKMTGHDRASFGRNSKTLHQWTRGQINVGALDPNNNDLLGFTCGKASNGREFAPFAARLTENMVYVVDPTVDVNQEVASASGSTQLTVSDDEVADLCPGEGISKAKLVKLIKEQHGASKNTAYRAVEKAVKSKKVRLNTTTKLLQDRRL